MKKKQLFNGVFLFLALNTASFAGTQNKLTDEQLLGELLYQDQNLSVNRNQACADCHSLAPSGGKSYLGLVPGFIDTDNVINNTAISGGSVVGLNGTLNAPSTGYAAYSPEFHFDALADSYVGGQFWNGRASNVGLQAQGPVLNPLEMGMPSQWSVVDRIKENNEYKDLFWKAFSIKLDHIPSSNPRKPSATPPASVVEVFTLATQAIGEFEKTFTFSKFTSKYDYVLAGKTRFTQEEHKGLTLFNGKAKCSSCHVSTPTINNQGKLVPPLFTDYTYSNIGLPRNVEIPGNPAPNLGLGGRSDIAALDPHGRQIGKHKVMSLRNIALTAPYGHNGVMANLEQIVHFFNTRDILGKVNDNTDPEFGINGWPKPEVPKNVNKEELGNLGLTQDEEKALVAFLKTLTDDYQLWGNDARVPSNSRPPFHVTPE